MERLTTLNANRILLCGALLGLLGGWAWPPHQFRSQALVEVAVPANTQVEDVQSRIAGIFNELTEADRLAVIIQDLGLYSEVPPQTAITQMRKGIEIVVMPSASQVPDRFVVRVAFQYVNRHEAPLVVWRLLQELRSLPSSVIDAPTFPRASWLNYYVPLEIFGELETALPGLLIGVLLGMTAGGAIAVVVHVHRLQRRVAELAA